MVKLEIKQINNEIELFLADNKTGKGYKLLLEIFGDVKPQVGDILVLHEDLLNPNSECYSQPYFFDCLESEYGRDVEALQDNEKLALLRKENKWGFKRVYG